MTDFAARFAAERRAVRRRLRLAALVTSSVLIGELVGGLMAGSLALLSDAGHVATDLGALMISWFAAMQAERPATSRMSYGYHRLGVMAALVNGAVLIGLAFLVMFEAYRRFQDPPVVQGQIVLVIAIIGLFANLASFGLLQGFSRSNINVASAVLHVIGDILGSVGVIAAAIGIMLTGKQWLDPAISVLISGIMIFGAVQIIRQATAVLLEASPTHVEPAEVLEAMAAVPGVLDAHDLHIWTIAPQVHILSGHVVVDDQMVSQSQRILQTLDDLFRARFNIHHSTLQVESALPGADNSHCFLR